MRSFRAETLPVAVSINLFLSPNAKEPVMKISLLILAAVLLVAAPMTARAKQPAEVTWRAAETEPESAEENRAHAEGRAVDINEVNKMPVGLAVDKNAPAEKRAIVHMLLRNMEAVVREDVNVQVFISPIGGFHRDPKTRRILREATQAELDAHWDHIHIATME